MDWYLGLVHRTGDRPLQQLVFCTQRFLKPTIWCRWLLGQVFFFFLLAAEAWNAVIRRSGTVRYEYLLQRKDSYFLCRTRVFINNSIATENKSILCSGVHSTNFHHPHSLHPADPTPFPPIDCRHQNSHCNSHANRNKRFDETCCRTRTVY